MSAYSVKHIKSSLLHFGVGKLGSGMLGFALLLLLVRHLPPADYAAMVAVLAAFEIAQLVLNFGVLPATWRYLPEAKSIGSTKSVARVARASLWWRTLPLAIACLVLQLWPEWPAPLFGQAGANSLTLARLFAGILLFEGICRHIDLLFELLLMQRISQGLILVRALIRMLGLAIITDGFAGDTNVPSWALVELSASVCGLGLGLAILYQKVLRVTGDPNPEAEVLPGWRRVLHYALPAYGSQLLGAFQGFDACKFLAAQFAPAPIAAGLGFTLSLVATVQRYLPSYLLMGFVRPIFVHVSARPDGRANAGVMASLLVKINLLILLPAVAAALVIGGPLISGLSGGRAIGFGDLLVLALLALMMQMLHMVIGLLALAAEESRSGLVGTAMGMALFILGAVSFDMIGVNGLVGLVVACEAIWCAIAMKGVALRGIALALTLSDMAKLVGAFGCALLAAVFAYGTVPGAALLVQASVVAAACIAFVGSMALMKPLNEAERRIVLRLVPARLHPR